MKKLVAIFIFIILFLFFSICLVVGIDKNNINKLEDKILKNTEIKEIEYINKYDNNYLVLGHEYLYLFNADYEEIYKVKLNLIHDNENNYELIYRDKTIMYMDNYKNDKGIVFKYYDIYTYELIDEIIVGDN